MRSKCDKGNFSEIYPKALPALGSIFGYYDRIPRSGRLQEMARQVLAVVCGRLNWSLLDSALDPSLLSNSTATLA